MTAVNELTYVKWARKGKLRRTHYRRVFSRESELRYTWAIMKTKLFSWLGTEFVEITGEAKAGAPPDSSVNELFRQFEAELKSHGLSLDNTARIRVWGRDKDARTLATAARSKILTGNRKAASSSFISRQWFDSDVTNPCCSTQASRRMLRLSRNRCRMFCGLSPMPSRCQAQAGVKSSSSQFCLIEPGILKCSEIFSPKVPKWTLRKSNSVSSTASPVKSTCSRSKRPQSASNCRESGAYVAPSKDWG